MSFNEKLREYARLTVMLGGNVQPGQQVFLTCPVICPEFARMIMKECYSAGASEVVLCYYDEKASRIKLINSPLSVFEKIPAWEADRRNFYGRNGAAMITVLSEDPGINAGVDGEKLLALARAKFEAYEEYYRLMDEGAFRWTLVAYPFPEWATKVFPGVPERKAVDMLWNAVFRTVRIGRGDTLAKWQKHDRMLKRRSDRLNRLNFEAIECKNSLGTDISVGLAEHHIWVGGSSKTADGIPYFANMPTEEIFTMPDCRKTNGRVFSSLPLSYQGTMIDRFSLTFRDGAVVDFTAEVGYDALARMLDTDEGARRIGEIALIPYNSPIREQNILFYNTLFDENASCHMALGVCYAETVKGGESLDRDGLLAVGGNQSAIHVDFMFGTSDMEIVGVSHDGSREKVFEQGNFVF